MEAMQHCSRNKLRRCDLIHQIVIQSLASTARWNSPRGMPMNTRINDDRQQIDHRTCMSICDAIGERLEQRMRPETELSPRLRELVEELRRRDNELH
jgi:hypothetical protein